MKKLMLILLSMIIIGGIAVSASADETLSASLDKESCGIGEYIRVTSAYNGAYPLGAFLVDMNYDPESLRYVKTENISGDHVMSAELAEGTRTVYTKDESGSGDLFSLVFKVLPGAEELSISVRFYDIVDTEGVTMGDAVSYDLSSKLVVPSGDALLLDLIPSSGELNEDFSPNTFSYTMSVPYEVDSITFEAVVTEGAKCSINRKNLGTGGSTTDFILTVTSEDGDTKNQYIVSVTRGEYVRPSGSKNDEITDVPEDTSKEDYETITPEYTGEEEEASVSEEFIDPEIEMSAVKKPENTAISTGGGFGYFLAGAGLCLGCVLVGVLIAMLFSKTGKHGKH